MTISESFSFVNLLDERARLDSRAISAGALLVELPLHVAAVVSRAYAAADYFFSLEDREKQAFDARANGTVRGWTKTSSIVANIEADHQRDYEAFDIALPRTGDLTSPIASRLFDQANAWPSDELRIASEELVSGVCVPLERSIWSLLERSVGLSDDFFAESCAEDGLRYLRYLTYPPRLAGSPAGGFYPHTDFEAFTIHMEDSPGMEVHDPETGDWIQVRHGAQHCLVLVGRLGELLSSGMLKAALHRVRVQPSARRRHAIAYFSAPSFDTHLPPANDPRQEDDTVGAFLTRNFMKSFGIAR